jgi:hypothetical protein
LAGNTHYLRPILNAGSSRVFNCNDRMKKLVQDNAADPYFFKVKAMHSLVIVKEALPADDVPRDGTVVGTKLYFPYNSGDIYEGGRSIFYSNARLFDVLHEQFGVPGAKISEQDVTHDINVLRVLDALPSLDGFLMSDALKSARIPVNELYFEVPEDERVAIQQCISGKFEPLIQAAFGMQGAAQGIGSQFIEKMWEAKDKVALAPLIKACRFPEEEALSIFSAWKGINFYTFEYERTRAKREQFALWLRDNAIPNTYMTHADIEHVRQLRRGAIQRLRQYWTSVDSIAQTYDVLYAKFLTSTDGVANFLEFLRQSRQIYWQMGASLSKINHAINCWTIATGGLPEVQLPAGKLQSLLEILRLILVQDNHLPAAPTNTEGLEGSPMDERPERRALVAGSP